MIDFMEVYCELDFPYRNLIRGLLEKLNEGKKIPPKGFFAMHYQIYKKKLNMSNTEIGKKIQEKYDDETDVANTLRHSVQRDSQRSVHSKEVAEAMGISENELLYGIDDESVINTIPVISVDYLYNALPKKWREAVLDLTRNLWTLEHVPEVWEDSDYSKDWDNPEEWEDFNELENPKSWENSGGLKYTKDIEDLLNKRDNVVRNLTKTWWNSYYAPTDSELEKMEKEKEREE